MKQLEELTADIREKLPRLTTKYHCEYLGEVVEWEAPMLNDVLQWLYILFPNSEYYINTKGDLCKQNSDRKYDDYYITWDLSKPFLKDQSPELITFLHSLIKTKQ